jgi:pyroglutamyl-peptidase
VTRALVTGFEPFGGAEVNASQRLVEALAAEPPDELELATAVLPVVWARAGDELAGVLEREQPELVVCFGQADGRAQVEVERFALNFDDGTDDEGEQRRTEIVAGGPVAYRSSLPVDAVVDALRADGIPAAASRDAGGYLCNHVFYALMSALADRPEVHGGFVHVPLLPEQALDRATPTLPLSTLQQAAGIILAAAMSS